MTALLHIASRSDMALWTNKDSYAPGTFADEGFIHCCWPRQLPGVIERYLQGRGDLLLLELDKSELGDSLVEEDLYNGGDMFPHIYGHLPKSSIRKQTELTLDDAANIIIPAEYRTNP